MNQKGKIKERIIEMWVVAEKRTGLCFFRRNKKMILYKDKPRKKNPWDEIVKIKVIVPKIIYGDFDFYAKNEERENNKGEENML